MLCNKLFTDKQKKRKDKGKRTRADDKGQRTNGNEKVSNREIMTRTGDRGEVKMQRQGQRARRKANQKSAKDKRQKCIDDDD